MNRKLIYFILTALVLVWGCFSVLAAATEFSANLTMTMSNGQAMTGKVFVKGEKIRNEVVVMGQSSTTIARQDKLVTWILIPAAKQYREVAMKFDPTHPTKDIQYDTKDIGTDKANGYDCKLIQYTFKNQEYGIVVQWMATRLNMPVRFQVKNKAGALTMTIDYTNINVGSQADSLFEIPAGYVKVSTP